MPMNPVRFVLALGFFSLGTLCAAAREPEVLWRVEVRTRLGTRHVGFVRPKPPWTGARVRDRLDLRGVDPGARLTIEEFDGLRGSLVLSASDLVSARVLGEVGVEKFTSLRAERRAEAAERRARSVERRARARAALRARSQEAAAQAEPPAGSPPEGGAMDPYVGLPEEQRRWLERFPPEEGWIPSRRDDLYHEDVILDSRPLTEEERAWLDHFEEWKAAYDAWLRTKSERRERPAALKSVPHPPSSDP